MSSSQAVALPQAAPSVSAFAELESLLRARRLDQTLTTALPARPGEDAVAPFGLVSLDARLFGGVPRGHVSELIGPVSSGRTSLAWTWLGAATARAESVALIDTFDRFDPASAVRCGIDLSRLLWVRGQAITKTAGAIDPAWLPGARAVDGPGTLLERTIDRSLKSLNLVLQSGVCTAVVFDFADVPVPGIRRVPLTTWMRLQRVVEGTDIACLLIGPVPLARSAGGITIATGHDPTGDRRSATVDRKLETGDRRLETGDRRPETGDRRLETGDRRPETGDRRARWSGAHDRNRRLAGLAVSARLSSPRRTVHGTIELQTVAHDLVSVE